jgi:hypothetical protein
MAKFSQAKTSTRSRAVIKTVSTTPDTVTYEGAPAYKRDNLSELFLLGVGNFVGEDTFYEKADDRDNRFATLARTVAVNEPEWFAKFVAWLRSEGNMRSAPLVAVAEGVKARLSYVAANPGTELAGPTNSELVSSVLQRADEAGELLAYWKQHYGDETVKLPKPLKRGIDNALAKIYSEYSALKYDTAGKSVRFGDVVQLVHATSATEKQEQLYGWLVDRRRGKDGDKQYPLLEMVNARAELQAVPADKRREFLASNEQGDLLKRAGVTWEWLSSWLGGTLDASFWESVIPTMPYMATLRNLRNFDQAGIARPAAQAVAAKLEDPAQVARSRQFPYRFLSAYKALDSVTYAPALEAALDLSTQNIPELGGRTLILVDTSGSMEGRPSERSQMTMMEMGALFAVALAKKGEAVDLYGFADDQFKHTIKPGASVLREVERFTAKSGSVGYGTQTAKAVTKTYAKHDRVVIFTDGQTFGGGNYWGTGNVTDAIPATVPMYAFNLAGYAQAMIPSGKNRYEIGGVTDQTFKQIKLLEAGQAGTWPWED